MPSRRPSSLNPLSVVFIADAGPSSHEVNIHRHAESHSTHDGGFVYSSHTKITSESVPSVYGGHRLPPSRQMSTVSSREPRLLPAPPSIGPPPPPPPYYASSPYTHARSRSAAPSYASSSSSSRTARQDSVCTPSLTTATGSSRRCPPVASRGRSRLPQQVLMLCDAPSSNASSQRRSKHSGVQSDSTVTPESSVSNQTYNAEKAARKDKESRGRTSRRSSSQCR
ncbi:hypothetical protein MY11210_006185 [Beauveria gryllotalpidicola]